MTLVDDVLALQAATATLQSYVTALLAAGVTSQWQIVTLLAANASLNSDQQYALMRLKTIWAMLHHDR